MIPHPLWAFHLVAELLPRVVLLDIIVVVMSDLLAQAGVKRPKEMTAVLQHMDTCCDPPIYGFESAILLINKRENYSWLNKTLNRRGGRYLWESVQFLNSSALQTEALVSTVDLSNSKVYSGFKGGRRLERNI